MAGIKLNHVPYKGTGPALTDTIAGQTDLFCSSTATALPHVKAGRLRALAVTTANRLPAEPNVPTLAESGVKGYDVPIWHGLIAPKGMPQGRRRQDERRGEQAAEGQGHRRAAADRRRRARRRHARGVPRPDPQGSRALAQGRRRHRRQEVRNSRRTLRRHRRRRGSGGARGRRRARARRALGAGARGAQPHRRPLLDAAHARACRCRSSSAPSSSTAKPNRRSRCSRAPACPASIPRARSASSRGGRLRRGERLHRGAEGGQARRDPAKAKIFRSPSS